MSDSDLRDALQRIHDRHERDDNDYRYLLSEDPLEVLTYLQRLGHRGLVGNSNGHDVKDALILRVWLWWKGEQAEVWLLEQTESLGLNRRDVGRTLNLGSGQGLVDRLKVKRRMLAAARPGTQRKPEPVVSSISAQQRWATNNRDAVLTIARTLVEHWDLVQGDDEATDWLEEVRRDVQDQVCTPGAINLIRFAVDAMSTVETVREQPPSHPLQQAIAAWHPLIQSYPQA